MDALLDFLYQTHILHVWYYLSSFIAIISVIVFIHEFGHYGIAKACGVKIEEFALGFGPEIFGINDRSGTRWKFCAIPMGGYVKMFGDMNPASAPDNSTLKKLNEDDRKKTFHAKNLWQKSAIVSGGPIANFILAIVILAGFLMVYGQMHTLPVVGEVVKESAAEAAGLMSGDEILKVDGTEIKDFADIQSAVSINTGTPIAVSYRRADTLENTMITPKIVESQDLFGNKITRALIGITSSMQPSYSDPLPLFPAIGLATKQTYTIAATNLKAIGQIIIGQRSIKDMGGPIKISKYSGQAVRDGLQAVLWFMAMLSISLGLINLFPIPVLDGGHLLYYIVEAVRGKPVAEKFQEYALKAGMAFILTLAIVVSFNDLLHLLDL
ncbi:MAG: zinc metalloprotease [Rickettsiales bacterium]|jgi:regulator of sigma E protease|nr:zinc metalloprotease [Rickettsiales bacterium]